MPVVMVRNNQAGPTVLSSDPKGTHYVEWQGKDDAAGGDYQPVPEQVQETVAYQKAVRRGILTEVDEEGNDVVSAAMDRQQKAWDKRQNQTQETGEGAIDRQANKDMISVPCVGPSREPGKRCAEPVTVRDKAKDEAPPLCNLHIDLAPQYVPAQEFVGDRSVTVWTKVTMGPRETQN